jgi:hypothetical protein
MPLRFLTLLLFCLFLVVQLPSIVAAEDMILADFESDNYGEWAAIGEAFGARPAAGTIGEQQLVSGFLGQGLVNTYIDGDSPVGTLTSPEFVVDQHYLNFLIGGGAHNSTRIELEIDDKVRFKASGHDIERLDWKHFDLREFQGETARLRIVDEASGPWGHVNIDQVTLSAEPQGSGLRASATPLEMRQEMIAVAKEQGFSKIVFTTREVDSDGHWYANFSYRMDNPDAIKYHNGGRLCSLDLETGETTLLLEDLEGGVRDPQLHYDGQKILFSYRKGGQPFFHLYEINIDGSGLRQLTDGPYDDMEACYLPCGNIAFCSSRCNRAVNCWYTRVAIIYRCDADGNDIRPLSANIEQDNTPWMLPDGRLIHQRWEYVDRSQVRYHHLWTMNPDGTNQMVYFGNMHPSTVMIDAKPIPGTNKVCSLFSPGHGQKEHAGRVTIIDPSTGPDNQDAAVAISNELYRDPYPLSEDLFIVARNGDFGLLRGDGSYQAIWSIPDDWKTDSLWVHEPRPIRAREREQVIPDRVDPSMPTGQVLLDNVYIGRNMNGVEHGDIKKLLILETLPKPVNFSGDYAPMSFGGTFTLERVLGTVPVEEDGSANFELPAMRSIFFVALDEKNMSVKRMQSFMTVQPGERISCIGCHENRGEAPRSPQLTIAMRRPPSQITPLAEIVGEDPVTGDPMPTVFDFPRDIQPILDRHCLACHDYEETEQGGPRAGGIVLSGDHGAIYSHSFYTLITKGLVIDAQNGDGNRPPRAVGTSASPIMQMLDGQYFDANATIEGDASLNDRSIVNGGVGINHHDVQLSTFEKDTIRYWIESANPYPGTYASLGCGRVGGSVKRIVEQRCDSCHNQDATMRLPSTLDDIHYAGFAGGHQVLQSNPIEAFRFGSQAIFNLTRPDMSTALLAPLSKEAGGYGICRPLNEDESGPTSPVFKDKSDPDYIAILEVIQAGHDNLNRIKRFDMPDFQPNVHYIREMQVYGILPQDLDDTAPINSYETDEIYWQSLWHTPSEF